jgi:hypothetical protein
LDLLGTLAGTWADGTRPKDLYASTVSKAPARWLPTLVEGLGSADKRVQNGCAELCSMLSADAPSLVYAHAERFREQLRAKEPVVRWEGACTLGNLAHVDERGVVVACVPALTAQLAHESIVLQGHSVRALSKVAAAHPSEAPGILEAFVHAEKHFAGSRVGYLVEAMEVFAATAALQALHPRVERFVRRHLTSPAASVAKKAARVMRLLGRVTHVARVTPAAMRKKPSALEARAKAKRARAKRA